MSYKNTLIGCDPEVFVRNATTGEFVSAHNLIPGNKQEPFVVPLGAVQVDGMACEFNTNPANSKQEFIDNVQGVFKELTAMLPTNLSLAPGIPVAHFTPEVFAAQPLEALELGCEADYNAYTGRANPRPNAHNKPMRTAAGHIHIGFEDTSNPFSGGHMSRCCDFVKILDVIVGLSSLEYDSEAERRSMYGKAGCFRPKPYGAEYRVLSNAWIKSPELIGRVYDETMLATELFMEGAQFDEEIYTAARSYINASDVKSGLALLQDAKAIFGV